MLVLTRAVGEEVVLTLPDGRRIVVQVLGRNHQEVRLGFLAPEDVVIKRRELLPPEGREPARRS
jgi:carbon storage regulator CsrA